MKKQEYLDLRERQRKEVEEFPVAYAFNDEQLKEALVKLGAKSKNECVTVFGHGDIVKRENAKPFIEMLKRHSKEIKDRLIADKEFAEAAFMYEMDNHEYMINYDGDGDVLGCFGLEMDDLEKTGLDMPYFLARKKHIEQARERGIY